MQVGANETVAVHYKGATNSEADFMSGRITYRFDTRTAVRRLGPKVKCLATLTESRLPDTPDCPTFAEYAQTAAMTARGEEADTRGAVRSFDPRRLQGLSAELMPRRLPYRAYGNDA